MHLIIIDGLDGVGKDTHARLIKRRYELLGKKVVIRSHPESDNYYGKKTKKALLGKGKLNRLIASIFYMMDVLRSIRKYYRRNDIDVLIIVRYLVGTAYLPGKLAKFTYDFFLKFVPTSNYMFFLDADPKNLLDRFKSRKNIEMFENYEKLVKVRKKAKNLVKNWYIIDSSNSVEETYFQIENILKKLDNV